MISKTVKYGKTTSLLSNARSNSLTIKSGFTIVELLVVIVVIGILAAITIVSYSGITQKATVASLQSDLANSAKKLKMYYALYGSYPTSIDNVTKCPTAPNPDTNYCLKASSTHTYTNYSATANTFNLTETSANNTIYTISDSTSPQVSISLAVSEPANWLAIGTQVWAKYNLNVGTRIAGSTNQINNPGTNIVEKYCYGDTDAGCTNTNGNGIPYGAFYQWDEAMKYVTTENTQGICPAGSHIPSDNDWKILEIQLGMSQAQADLNDAWRGTDQGTKLKSTGISGLNVPFAGVHTTVSAFSELSSDAYLWTSSESSTSAWRRYINSGHATVGRFLSNKADGFSVRCIGN